jgi:hypothetical protein
MRGLCVASGPIYILLMHRNASIPKCTPCTDGGRHRYGEIPEHHDGLTDVKSTPSVGDTLGSLNFMSDGRHISNFAGDKKEWPVYITIGKISSKLCEMPSMHSVVMVALHPIAGKNHNIAQKWLDMQRQTNQEVLNKVLWQVLQPLTCKQYTSTESGYYSVLCSDANFRHCKPVLAACLADYPEDSDLHHLKRHVCL